MKKDKPVAKTNKGGMQGPHTSQPRGGSVTSNRESGGKPYVGDVGPNFGQGPMYRGNKPA